MILGVLIDGMRVAQWQANALLQIAPDCEFVLFNNEAPRRSPRRMRHGLYYVLNALAVRNQLTRRVALPVTARATHSFKMIAEGNWSRLPDEVIEIMKREGIQACVKFDASLLRVPPADQLPVPILSYHHGDPHRYRGRPAGFYEIRDGTRVMGQVVQVLSNDLDGGKIAASAETKVIHHSYKATLLEAYRHSPLLLRKAIRNTIIGTSNKGGRGTNYRLPTNASVLLFALKLVMMKLRRLTYGVLFEKRWQVATAEISTGQGADTPKLPDSRFWTVVDTPRDYRFLADPFFDDSGALLVEALNSKTNKGEILQILGEQSRVLPIGAGHASYPSVFETGGKWYMLPETSDWAPPFVWPLGGGEKLELDIPGRPRMLDPTILEHEGVFYLFGNIASESSSVLRLWFSDAIDGPFQEHPASPIQISPAGARMAGSLLRFGSNILRAGQDGRDAYGDGLIFFKIEELDRTKYRESKAAEVRFSDRRGPHTFNLRHDRAAFDFYRDRFSALAWLHRLQMSRVN